MTDIIGDIHGHADELRAILSILGYRESRGAYRHPAGRKALFVGDIIDRGPAIKESVEIVRGMVEASSATCLCGNHEYNALCWHTSDPEASARTREPHRFLRSHTPVHQRQHEATLDAYGLDEHGRPLSRTAAAEWRATLDWIRSLPLWYDDGAIRACHAAWSADAIAAIDGWSRERDAPGNRAGVGGAGILGNESFLVASTRHGSPEYEAIETLLKGTEWPLPDGSAYSDKDGARRTRTRTRWWLDGAALARSALERGASTVGLGRIAMPPADTLLSEVQLPVEEVARAVTGYSDSVPVFCGHYWLTGTPIPLTPRVACLDYSVARGGSLCGYRYDGEEELSAERFVCVSAATHPGAG